MGNVFGISEADRLREEIKQMREHERVANLLATMTSFVTHHTSTSLQNSSSVSDKNTAVEFVSFHRLLEITGLHLPDALPNLQWRQVRSAVCAEVYDHSKERAGVHPRLHKILKLCAGNEALFKIVYEKSFEISTTL